MSDFIELNLSPLGWPHTASCLVAMAAFFPLMFARKGGAKHRAWGKLFALSYAVACLTGLGIYRLHKFFFPHWLAIGGLVVLGIGYGAVRYKPRGWRIIHLTAMLISACNLFGGAINEAFLHIKVLQAIGGIASPWVGVAQGINGDITILLIVFYIVMLDLAGWRRYPRAVKTRTKRPDYGIDAPAVVRNLFLVAGMGIALWHSVTLLSRHTALHIPQIVYVLILTTFARPGYLRRAHEAGATGYLLKDSPSATLAEAVRRVHAGLRAVDPALAAGAWTEDDPLTDRERQALRLASEGATSADIAGQLHLSEGTVRNYPSEAISKLGANNRVEAARIARGKGWL